MKKTSGILMGLLMTSSLAFSAEVMKPSYSLLNAKDIKWTAAPAAFPAGARMAVLQGNPEKAGILTVRMMLPANYRIPVHSHSQTEAITVISGRAEFGFGKAFNTAGLQVLTAGGFLLLPGKTYHYLRTKTPAVVQITTQGPFDLNVLDADDQNRLEDTDESAVD